MKNLKLFEKFSAEEHLKERGIDTNKTHVVIDEDDTYFFLYNFSGQLVGYQKYNPNFPKINQNKAVLQGGNPREVRYFHWVGEENEGKKIAVWGLESVDIMNDKFLFITEGIFDCARIHEAGYPGIAALSNNPLPIRSWLDTLPQKKIVIYDNDEGGHKLIKFGDYAYTPFKEGEIKDLNDMTPEDAKEFLDKCLKDSNII